MRPLKATRTETGRKSTVSEIAPVQIAPPSPSEGPKPAASPKQRVAKAASWEVGAQVFSLVLRLGSNLILTRLLYPEIFGLMALTQSVSFMLFMLSDVGLSQAVIASSRSDDPRFLDTAWTLQVLRGVLLFVAGAVLTWPCAYLLDEPRLLWLLPLGNIATLIHGFSSTKLFTLRRQMQLVPILKLEMLTASAGAATIIALAYLDFGIAAPIAGIFVSTILTTVVSHLLPGSSRRPSFVLDPTAKREILHFGRWIFLSSCLTAGIHRGDQLLLGRFVGAAQLGIYQVALALSEVPDVLIGRVINGVLFPALAQVHNQAPADFAKQYYRTRLWLDPPTFLAIGGLVGMAGWIIDLLYDDRYSSAAVMLQILALRTAVQISSTLCETCFFAKGESSFSFRRNLFVSVAMLISIPIGHAVAGIEGILWATVVARAFAFPVLWPAAHARGFFRWQRELIPLPFLAAGYALGTLLQWVLPAF